MSAGQVIWDLKRKPPSYSEHELAQLEAAADGMGWTLDEPLMSCFEPHDPTGRPPIDWMAINREFS